MTSRNHWISSHFSKHRTVFFASCDLPRSLRYSSGTRCQRTFSNVSSIHLSCLSCFFTKTHQFTYLNSTTSPVAPPSNWIVFVRTKTAGCSTKTDKYDPTDVRLELSLSVTYFETIVTFTLRWNELRHYLNINIEKVNEDRSSRLMSHSRLGSWRKSKTLESAVFIPTTLFSKKAKLSLPSRQSQSS